MSRSGSPSIPSILAHEQYFGFQQRPFELSPDPRFLYRSASHDAATGQLIQALNRGEGFLVLAGDIGTGKTTLCRNLLNLVGPTSFTSLILNPFLSADELLRQVLLDFGVVSREAGHDARFSEASTRELMSTLHEFLQSLAAIGGRAVILIDEAQHLSKEALEQIRVLSNLEASDTKLLQVVLVGQLNLLDTLNHADMRQYAQRISLRATLTPLTREETEAYIRHRITVAVPRREVLFTTEAVSNLHTMAEGIPRVINLLCDRALAFTAQDSETTVTSRHVLLAAGALNLVTAPPPEVFRTFADRPVDTQVSEPRNRRRLLATGLAVLVAVAIGVTLWLRPLPNWVDDAGQPALPGSPPASIRPDTSPSDVRPEDIVIPPPPARGLDDEDEP